MIDKRHENKGRPMTMNVVFEYGQGHTYIKWTCPKCNHRNGPHIWYGRDKYICGKCEEWTDIKGESAPSARGLHQGPLDQEIFGRIG